MNDDTRIFVNTPMEADLVEKLDEMASENENSRAQFIRLQIRKAWDEFQHVRKIKAKVEPKIKEVSKK